MSVSTASSRGRGRGPQGRTHATQKTKLTMTSSHFPRNLSNTSSLPENLLELVKTSFEYPSQVIERWKGSVATQVWKGILEDAFLNQGVTWVESQPPILFVEWRTYSLSQNIQSYLAIRTAVNLIPDVVPARYCTPFRLSSIASILMNQVS